jgi:signal transduction histidine kinase
MKDAVEPRIDGRRSSGMTPLLRSRLLAPFSDPDSYRALALLIVHVALGIAGLVVIPLFWGLSLLFAITPLVVPLLIAFRAAVGGLSQAGAKVARQLVGAEADPPVLSESSGGFWGRWKSVLSDRAFWRQQAYLLASLPIAFVPLVVLSFAVQVVTVPIWYRWADGGDILWLSNADSFLETLPVAVVGLGLLLLGVHLLKPFARIFRRLASGLLAGRGPALSSIELRELRLRAFRVHASVTAFVALFLIAIWALTTQGYFWPIWAILPLTFVLGVNGWLVFVQERPELRRRTAGSESLALHLGLSALTWFFLFFIWLFSTGGDGYFWPVWPLLALALLVAIHGAFASHGRGERIKTLETTRAGAVDVQETELRRIERDLHDGAQARLVALGMSLGMAEQKLQSDPEAVGALLAEARQGASEALEELRVLARGIHPPILTDRGLEAAVSALVMHSPLQVALAVDVPDRPSAAVESAAYFTVSEALANAIKHGEARRVEITIRTSNGVLVAEITDDGRGGANANGDGLKGLRQRVEALDGTLRVSSPEGGPTTVRAVMPCGS